MDLGVVVLYLKSSKVWLYLVVLKGTVVVNNLIKYCKTCLNPSTRPNTFFSDEGLCPVCVYEKEKVTQTINWDKRCEEIQQIKQLPQDT